MKLYAVKSKFLYVGYLLLIVLSVRVYSTEAYKSSAVLLGAPIVYNSLLSSFVATDSSTPLSMPHSSKRCMVSSAVPLVKGVMPL